MASVRKTLYVCVRECVCEREGERTFVSAEVHAVVATHPFLPTNLFQKIRDGKTLAFISLFTFDLCDIEHVLMTDSVGSCGRSRIGIG